jgi:hypothetical protein
MVIVTVTRAVQLGSEHTEVMTVTVCVSVGAGPCLADVVVTTDGSTVDWLTSPRDEDEVATSDAEVGTVVPDKGEEGLEMVLAGTKFEMSAEEEDSVAKIVEEDAVEPLVVVGADEIAVPGVVCEIESEAEAEASIVDEPAFIEEMGVVEETGDV